MTIPKAPAFSTDEYRRRLGVVSRRMAERDLDGLVLFGAANINYLTGMDSENLFDVQACILPRGADPVLVIFDFERGRFDNSAWMAEPVAYGGFDDPGAAVCAEVRRLGLGRGRVGIDERAPGVPGPLVRRVQVELADGRVDDAFGVVEGARLVKSEAEIAYVRRAAAFTDAGVRAGYQAIRVGAQDASVGAAIIGAMYGEGSDPVCWGPVVAAGYRSGLAHSSFNGYTIRDGDAVFLELTGEHRRYVAPVMRTAIAGRATPEHRRLAQASSDAVAAILEAARAGTPARDVAAAGFRFIQPVERDVVFHYYFGYPVGLGYPPSWIETLGFFIRTDNAAPLEAGMVFHLPMSLRVAGRYGVCLSQTMLVTKDGGVPLTGTPAALVEV